MISQVTIDEVRNRASLLEIIGEKVELKRSGSSHSGLCPFHSEKSPSFYVHEEEKYYHCFGCGASGNVITFLMRMQGLSFPEAVESLASKYQIEIQREGEVRKQSNKPDIHRLVKKVNAVACGYFENCLKSAPRVVLDYLEKRGLSADIQQEFGIGFSSNAWHDLSSFLKSQGVSEEAALLSGLVRRNKRGELYDLFRARIIFPIRGFSGEVVAFGGRIVPGVLSAQDESKSPKYINSPETPAYRKSEVLYGFFEHVRDIREKGEVLLVEGYLDVIGLHAVGVKNAVATCGTATTNQHVRRLARSAKKLSVVFDGDQAGRAAAAKCFELFLNSGVDGGAVFLPEGEDPDSIAKEYQLDTAEYFRQAKRVTLLELYVEELVRSFGSSSVAELGAASKGNVGQELAKLLARVENSIERNELIRQGAFALMIETSQLEEMVAKCKSDESGRAPGMSPTDNSVPSENDTDELSTPLTMISSVEDLSRVDREILQAVMAYKETLLEKVLSDADVCMSLATPSRLFLEGLHQILFSESVSEERKRSLTLELLRSFGKTWMALWKQAYRLKADTGVDLHRQFEECCRSIRLLRVKESLAELSRQISRCSDEARKAQLVHEKIGLERRVREISAQSMVRATSD